MPAEDIRHQEKKTHCLQKELGKNIKDKKRDKRGKDGAPSWEGSLKKERSFETPGNTFTAVCGKTWNHRGQHNWGEK